MIFLEKVFFILCKKMYSLFKKIFFYDDDEGNYADEYLERR